MMIGNPAGGSTLQWMKHAHTHRHTQDTSGKNVYRFSVISAKGGGGSLFRRENHAATDDRRRKWSQYIYIYVCGFFLNARASTTQQTLNYAKYFENFVCSAYGGCMCGCVLFFFCGWNFNFSHCVCCVTYFSCVRSDFIEILSLSISSYVHHLHCSIFYSISIVFSNKSSICWIALL